MVGNDAFELGHLVSAPNDELRRSLAHRLICVPVYVYEIDAPFPGALTDDLDRTGLDRREPLDRFVDVPKTSLVLPDPDFPPPHASRCSRVGLSSAQLEAAVRR